MTTQQIMQNAKEAKKSAILLTEEKKNQALTAMASALVLDTETILSENKKDIENARGKISDVMIDRLSLSSDRIKAMANGIIAVAQLPDPCSVVLSEYIREDGLEIRKKSVPMGVVAIIYESRPNVTSDAVALCLKSGNVCILRGGKEAYNSSKAIVNALRKGLRASGLSEDLVSLVDDITRQSATDLMTGVGYIDLLIPRGGAGLIKACTENAKVPCIETGTGICHIYIDKDADIEKAVKILYNAKTSRPSVCNACEVCLIHKDIAEEVLPRIKKALVDERRNRGEIPVELRLCDKAAKVIDGTKSNDKDFDTEFLDYILAVKVVDSLDEAIDHISIHSTRHSEAIITENSDAAELFTRSIDSSSLYINASTRFTDGGEFGLGCEMGISTQRLHARGPMGLRELTTYKYVITGDGHIR
ncbi:MAG: glutamate-5-semialdehyde dehydrogenase [Ruminococcaceae bacterium]|nr:glutamate-5-semialdehyde dehydrogenase [Oscillospiraceae bacterium]